MTSDFATVDLETGLPETDGAASEVGSESLPKRPATSWKIGIIAPIAGLILAISASPATAVSDYWFFERRRRDTITASWVLEGLIGMPISRVEALQIARQIIERAERERLGLAEWEALRGIQWEEDHDIRNYIS